MNNVFLGFIMERFLNWPLDVGVDETEGALKRDTKVDVPPVSMSWSKEGLYLTLVT